MRAINNEIIGFTAGNFDLLHPGYINCFKEAKRHCDKFVIFLQKDPSLHRKSKYKPIVPLYDRYKALMSIRYIDDVYTYQTEEELYNLIKFWKPDVRILGEDYIGLDFTGKDLNINVVYTTRSHEWSTTKIKDLITKKTLKQNPNINEKTDIQNEIGFAMYFTDCESWDLTDDDEPDYPFIWATTGYDRPDNVSWGETVNIYEEGY